MILMKILIFPIIIQLIPLIALFLVLRFLRKTQTVSIFLKIALGLITFILGLPVTYLAMNISMSGMSDKGITCAIGAITFIPLGLLLYVFGIPIILYHSKKHQRNSKASK